MSEMVRRKKEWIELYNMDEVCIINLKDTQLNEFNWGLRFI